MQAAIERNRSLRLSEEAAGNPRAEVEDPEPCRTCHGARVVVRTRKLAHPDFGTYVPCPSCSLSDRPVGDRLRAMGFNESHSFETWQDSEVMAEALMACIEVVSGTRWVAFLRGGVGCGKTHLATAAARRFVEQGGVAVFHNVPDLLDAIRACYDTNGEMGQYAFLRGNLYNRQLVVLDDLGANKPTPWSNAMLFEIVDRLYKERDHGQRLIVTTNINPRRNMDMVNNEPVIEERLLSRLSPGEIVIVNAPDRRKEFER